MSGTFTSDLKSAFDFSRTDGQKDMGAAFEANKQERDEALNDAELIYKEAVNAANDKKKNADAELNKALKEIPQDANKINGAKQAMSEADKEKADAKLAYKEAVNSANDDFKSTRADLHNDEKSRDNDAIDQIAKQGVSKEDYDKAETARLTGEGEGETSSQTAQNQGTEPVDNKNGVGKKLVHGASEAVKGVVDATKKDMNFSDSFYRDIGAMVKGKPVGNKMDAAATTAKEQAQNQRNEAANRQMEAQASQQIANQNAYTEAGKIASVQNDAENRQNINNTSFAAGTASARLRKTNAPDVQSQMQREDQQRNVANQRREEADAAQQGATQSEGESQQFKIQSRDYDNDLNTAGNLSNPPEETPEPQEPQEQTPEQTPEETPEETQPEETQPEETQPEETQQPEEPGDQPPAPEEPQEQEQEQEQPMPSGNPQHVINWLLGSSKGQDIQPQSGAEGDNGLAAWVQEKYGVQPAPKWKYDEADPSAKQWEQMWLNDGEISGDKQGAIQALRQGRAGEGNDASKNFDSSNMNEMNTNMTVESDERIKNIKACLSDLRMKHIKEDFDCDGYCSKEDLAWLLGRAGTFRHNDIDWDESNRDSMDDTVLKGYADFIRNYVYNYKPEATEIDSRIDPDEEHIGPMAQDIEKVNPACIKETPEGVKTVDTARLAMMNAGAIGDLARQLNELNEKFKALGL